jgi:hypothetical protein
MPTRDPTLMTAAARTALRRDPRVQHRLVLYWDQRAVVLLAAMRKGSQPPADADWQDLLDVCEGYRLAVDAPVVQLPAVDREAMIGWLVDVLTEAALSPGEYDQ